MPDYDKIFKFLSEITKEKQLNLYKFDLFCEILNIPNDIKILSKNLLIEQKDKFNQLRSRKKFIFYISFFFVAYVIKRCDYTELDKRIEGLITVFKNNRIFISKYLDLNRMLLIIRDKGYHPYLITDSLNPKQIEIYLINIYKIEILKFLNKLDKEIGLSIYLNDLEELVEPILYITRECFEPFEKFRNTRYSSSCYFLLSKIKKLQRIGIPLGPFYQLIQKSKNNIIEHIQRIEENLNYQNLVDNFSNFDFVNEHTHNRDD